MMKVVVISLISLLMISCISPSPYRVKTQSSHDGLLVKKINDTEYKITFYGNEETSQERANDFALLGAAQQAESHGYHYFSVLHKKSTNSSKSYVYSKEKSAQIKVVDKNGAVTYTNNYNASYGSPKKQYAITRPQVYTTVKFLTKKNTQAKNVFTAQQVINSMSKKYNLSLQKN